MHYEFFHTFAGLLNRVVARLITDWSVPDSQFSPNVSKLYFKYFKVICQEWIETGSTKEAQASVKSNVSKIIYKKSLFWTFLKVHHD